MAVAPDILIKLQDFARADLGTFRNTFFNWVLRSSYTVFAGVALEGPEAVHEAARLWRKYFSRAESTTDDLWEFDPPNNEERESPTPDWIKAAGIVGLILVVLGVAGEGISEGLVSAADGKLQTFNDLILSDAQLRAAEAEATAKGFDVQISDANARAAQAVAAAKQADLERMRLEALVAPRSLTMEQSRKVRDSLTTFRGRSVSVSSYGLDGEGYAIAAQLIGVFTAANIRVQDNRAGRVVSGGFEFGVQIRGPASEQMFLDALANALHVIGKLDVTVNGSSPRVGAALVGPVTMGGPAAIVGGGGPTLPAAPGPPGSPVTIFVGIRPVKIPTF